MKHVIICDLDGTVANLDHRLHHIRPNGSVHGSKELRNWDAFHAATANDTPHEDVIALLHVFRVALGGVIKFVYITGRVEATRPATELWMQKHELPEGTLHMRPDGDHRDDDMLKREITEQLELTPQDVWFVLEDRDRVVAMWRSLGFRCLQVAPGAF